MRSGNQRRILAALLALAVGLVAVAAAGGAATKGKPKDSATPVFKLSMKPSREVPKIKGLRADGVGHVTFDLTRDSAGAITSGEVIFYVNYRFPGAVTINGLHIHQGPKNGTGGVVVDAGIGAVGDADGAGNVTSIVVSVPPAHCRRSSTDPRTTTSTCTRPSTRRVRCATNCATRRSARAVVRAVGARDRREHTIIGRHPPELGGCLRAETRHRVRARALFSEPRPSRTSDRRDTGRLGIALPVPSP